MRNIAFAGSRYTWKTVKKTAWFYTVSSYLPKRCKNKAIFTPILRWPCLVASDALWNVDQAGFYVEPLSPEYQNDSKTPVRFVRKMVGIYGQVVKILTVCPRENVLIRTKWTFSHFVRGKACFYGQIVWISRFCPCKGRNRIPDSLWGMFEFSDSLARKTIPKRGRGYPTRELGWKPQMFWSKCRILGISNETVGLEGIESLFFA